MGRSVVLPVVSVILVVAVVVGAFVVVRHSSKENDSSHGTAASSKGATQFCQVAPFKDQCVKSVESVANNASATPQDYLIAALHATVEEVVKGQVVVNDTKIDPKADPYHHSGLEDCKQLLNWAVKALDDAITAIRNSQGQTHNLDEGIHDLMNWISAVYAFQTTCVDNFDKPEYKSAIQNGLINSTQLTHNAINIIHGMSDLYKALNVHNRKLLQTGPDGLPTWFGAADRKLLAGPVTSNAVVAQDNSAQYATITAALNAIPSGFTGRYVIYVKSGTYTENVVVTHPNVFIYGDGMGKTIVTGWKNFKAGVQTSDTATFAVNAEGFIARGITFRNTAGPEGLQAVALRISGDKAAVFECSMEGYQDTLYYQFYRQFYRDCVISGTVDFIFGKGSAVIQNSRIFVRKPMPSQFNAITADGRETDMQSTGVVLQNCAIIADGGLAPVKYQVETFLGRPWKNFALTVYMQSDLGDFIKPAGYRKWDGANFEQTCQYLEYSNRGPRADLSTRDKSFTKSWGIGAAEAGKYTVNSFIWGNSWLPATGVPFNGGL